MAERLEVNLRLGALRKLLIKEKASTQEELKAELEKLSFQVNQSTISRDLRKLGAIKHIDPNGRTVYRLAEDYMERLGAPSALTSLSSLVTDFDHNHSMVVIHTQPGSAPMVARMIDAQRSEMGIIGTIAGDDTVFVCPGPKTSPSSVIGLLKSLLR